MNELMNFIEKLGPIHLSILVGVAFSIIVTLIYLMIVLESYLESSSLKDLRYRKYVVEIINGDEKDKLTVSAWNKIHAIEKAAAQYPDVKNLKFKVM